MKRQRQFPSQVLRMHLLREIFDWAQSIRFIPTTNVRACRDEWNGAASKLHQCLDRDRGSFFLIHLLFLVDLAEQVYREQAPLWEVFIFNCFLFDQENAWDKGAQDKLGRVARASTRVSQSAAICCHRLGSDGGGEAWALDKVRPGIEDHACIQE